MAVLEEMHRGGLEKLTDKLKDVTREEFEAAVYDFSLLETALAGAAARMSQE